MIEEMNKILAQDASLPKETKHLYHKNCAETIIEAAIKTYLPSVSYKQFAKCFAGFGHGCQTGKTCGAFASSVAVIGLLMTEDKPNENKKMKQATRDFVKAFFNRYESNECAYIRKYNKSKVGCEEVIRDTGKILKEVLDKYEIK